jgi:hypothetical protein
MDPEAKRKIEALEARVKRLEETLQKVMGLALSLGSEHSRKELAKLSMDFFKST